MSTHPAEPSSSVSSSGKSKRQTILAACQVCRRKKVKCDGNRPCGYCKARGLDLNCHFEANEDETHRIAAKRKHTEISQSRDELQRLYSQIASRSEADAADIFRRIRRREDADSIVRHLEHVDVIRGRAGMSDATARETFLRHLLQSPASLEELLGFVANSCDDQMEYPSGNLLDGLRHEVIPFPRFAELLNTTNSARPVDFHPRPPQKSVAEDPGRFPVPGYPWTNMSDDAVTELISLYFNYLWPQWRLVEKDLFLEAMRGGRLESMLCSPFLVNAILALASMYSESEAAFAMPGDLLTRGQCFHDEAMRLWVEEEAHPSLTNIQGLMLLTIACSMSGKDRLGEVLLSAARHIERHLHTPSITELVNTGSSIVDFSKPRRGVGWSLGLLEVTCAAAHVRVTTEWKRELRLLPPEGLPDVSLLPSPEQWTGYPFQRDTLTLDSTTLWRERCKLVRQIQDTMNALLVDTSKLSATEYMSVGRGEIQNMLGWLRQLPEIVQWRHRMPVPVFDLHGQYYCTMITIYAILRNRLTDRGEGEGDRHLASELFNSLIQYACQATQLLCQYRQQYGLKIALPYLVQVASMTSGLLLQTMQSRQQSSMSIEAQPHTNVEIQQEIQTAFEESFRFLLSTGLQNMLARAIARMHYRTATAMEVTFSPAMYALLEMVDGAGWTPSDVERLSSSYPNFAMEKMPRESDGMEDLLRRWEGLAPT